MSGQSPLAKLVLILSLALLASPAAAIEIDPELGQKVATAARGIDAPLVDIMVVLDAPLDVERLESELEGLTPVQRRQRVVSLLKQHAAASQQSLLAELGAARGGVEDVKTLWISNSIQLRGDQRALDILAASPVLGRATENRVSVIVEVAERSEEPIEPTDDPGVPLENVIPTVWSLDWINVPQAWETGYDGTGVLIAHLDSGVWFDHGDLANRIWYNTAEIPDNGIDDDQNGYIDDYRGWDFGDWDNDPTDDGWDYAGGGHGTHTAGTVCGDGTNGLRTGVAPGATIMVLKPTWTESGTAATGAVWAAQQYAIDMGAHMMTMSLGGIGALPPALMQGERFIGDALRLARIPFFTSAGNAHDRIDPRYELTGIGRVPAPWDENPNVPYSSLSGVITVGATAFQEDTNWEFSSQGPAHWGNVRPWSDWDREAGNGLIKPDISAPGMGVSSLLRPNNYSQTNWNGTSMACPHAAGVAALMLDKNPSLTPADIARILMTTAVDLGAPGKDNVFGAGRIDAAAALEAVPLAQVASVVISDARIVDGNGNGYLETGEAFTLDLDLFNNNVRGAKNIRVVAAVTEGSQFVSVQNGSVPAPTIYAGNTGSTSEPLTFQVSGGARHRDAFEITVTVTTDAGFIGQYDLPFSIGRPALADHSAGNLELTVTEHGTLGWSDLDQLEGSGCTVPGAPSFLYIGGFWGGTGTDYVADRDYTLVTPGDWQASASPIGAIDEPVAKRSDHDMVAIFNDGMHPSPRGVQVTQRSMVWHDETTEDFIVIEYEVLNTGPAVLDDYYTGLFTDWDLYYYDYNIAGTDFSRDLAWMSEMYITQEHVGIMLLGDRAAANVSVVNNANHVHPYLNLPDPSKYKFMTGEYHRTEALDDGEYSVMVSSGPWTIPAGERIKVAFAVVYGTDLQDLQDNADAARAIYASTPVSSPPGTATHRLDLAQNYPNPFNPSTSIEFELAEADEVFLAVYDLAGRRVRSLTHRRYDAGRHSVVWDGRDAAGRTVASGTYLYRMTAGDEVLTRKMTLLK